MTAQELFETSLFNDPSLLQYYRMEGNSNDSKNGKNGTDTAISYDNAYGKFKKGATLNGSTSYIQLPYVNMGTAITMNFWYNPQNSVSGGYGILCPMKTLMRIDIGGATKWYYYPDTAGGNYSAGVNPTFTTGAWTMLTLTQTGGTIRFYQNGALLGSQVTGATNIGTGQDASNGDRIGSWGAGEIIPACYIDDVSFWNRVLTDAEISALYNGGLPSKGGGATLMF